MNEEDLTALKTKIIILVDKAVREKKYKLLRQVRDELEGKVGPTVRKPTGIATKLKTKKQP